MSDLFAKSLVSVAGQQLQDFNMPPNPPTLALRHNLKNLLETERITMADLSRQTGIAKQVLSDWIAGTHPRNIAQVKLVAQFFDVSIDDLCFDVRERRGAKIIAHFSGTFEGRVITIRITDSNGLSSSETRGK